MNRSSSTSAIILSLKPLGENNSSVTLLTPDNGIVYAVLYGGPKSRMRSLVSQWNSGKVWLYENPEKNQIKISDFEVSNYHTSFSQNLFKSYAASLAAELAIKTRCAGSAQQCHRLVSGFLDGMELCDEEQSRLGLLRFLWRYLELLGIQPQSHACSNCGKTFLDTRFAPEAVSYYNSMENSFICPDCADHLQGENMLSVKNTAVQYLSALTVLTPSEARKLTIDEEIYGQIRQLVFFLIENSIDQKLNSIETGMGIL
ncbi:DNA replication and repair protein RecO [Treponema bryantii]|uniref:DNA repair protein RecO n=1 Tax=Treponema bryantii TaxID=163 RepID=A0A1H9I935_9SPIR|nr:DNA repair protein RecO [Treponema bryantii]SEQ71062.1 DNA replication and repair protein RecO [Treponema bryantii]